MGRGRQKAKQTKVARELKYWSPNTDYEALARELHSETSHSDERHTGYGDDLDTDDEESWVDEAEDAEDDGWVADGSRKA